MASESISIVKICNIALSLVGEPIISSLAEQSKAARLCDLRYADIRDAVLRAHPWNCAIKRVALAQTTEVPAYGFTKVYQLPTDFLRLVKIENRDEAYKRVGRTIYANSDTFRIEYVYQVEDPTEFDSLLVQAIAAKLAKELCLPLARSATRMEALQKHYDATLSEARFIDAAEEDDTGEPQTSEWLQARAGFDEDPYRRISP